MFFVSFSILVTVLFFLYGFNCYYLLSVRRRYHCPSSPPLGRKKPRVAIHLPIYNEKYVVGRLLAACGAMVSSYGKRQARIVVIDDSDDDTAEEIDHLAAELGHRGIRVDVLRRTERTGFKAGALQLALEECREEYIAVFDADFVPQPLFLTNTVPHMAADDAVGVVQCRWEHMNASYNSVTKAVALGIDAHFFVEQPARQAAGCFLNFNGSAGLIRAAALRQAGGWQADTLSEDLDASYRMQLAGFRILYLRDVATPSEVPPTMPSFRRQQARWACGSLRAARKLLPRILADRSLGLRRRLQGFIHLTAYMVHPLMFLSFLLGACGAILAGGVFRAALPGVPSTALWCVIGACTVAVWLYPLEVLRARRMSIVRNFPTVLVLGLLGFGICFSNTVEAARALFGRRTASFRRTPKYAIQERADDWRGKKYQVPLDGLNVGEAAFAIMGAAGAACAFSHGDYAMTFFLLFYTAAFSYVVFMTILQSRQEAIC
jgi:cellulose synthase/poly-beta-1,6-N-acetylglucosamine synthase-like glycosyltransferase